MNIPALIPSFPTPKVIWYQTDVSVTLRIMLVDVDDYFLLVDEDHLRFSTTVNGRPYYLCLYLFGAIIPEKCSHRNTGTEIKVNLPKAHKWIRWMRLCLEKESNPHISADLEKLHDETIIPKYFVKRDWDDINEYKRQNNIVNIPPAEHSTDDSESEDEMMDALIDAADAF
ncbi:uncharacterized protein [Venturia canescens]|uniref:uncharacterized protein n=1 Tax=Venturia canescens TaxID=32260 RepID=UPI001C9D2934|nr:uncharacterized protein LOC122411024 [Venturia canescens]